LGQQVPQHDVPISYIYGVLFGCVTSRLGPEQVIHDIASERFFFCKFGTFLENLDFFKFFRNAGKLKKNRESLNF
jgi:hypothetical protein